MNLGENDDDIYELQPDLSQWNLVSPPMEKVSITQDVTRAVIYY
jgi:hypothetical protein